MSGASIPEAAEHGGSERCAVYITRLFAIALFSLAVAASARAQSDAQLRQELARIDSVHQMLLDSGLDNMANEDWYNTQMDRLLNKAYAAVLHVSSQRQKDALKIEQKAWLKKRDQHEKQVRKQITEENGQGTLTEQVVFGGTADFVRTRVVYLIHQLQVP
jgi:uncharacterized protein YecT (DUF1311 family)